MTTGSYSNPIIVDGEDARDGTCAGRRCHNLPAFDLSILRPRQQESYCLPDLFHPARYGIRSRRTSRKALGRQRSPSSPTKARPNGISTKAMTLEGISRNKTIKSARRKLAPYRSISELPHCSCTEYEGCAASCQNRAMCYDCNETNCRIGPRCTNRLARKVEARCKVLPAGDKGLGLFADEPIRRNQLVAQYTGEVITMSECRERYCSIYSSRQVSPRTPHWIERKLTTPNATGALRNVPGYGSCLRRDQHRRQGPFFKSQLRP